MPHHIMKKNEAPHSSFATPLPQLKHFSMASRSKNRDATVQKVSCHGKYFCPWNLLIV